MWLESLYHVSNLCSNFQFNMIWHRLSVAALIFCRRLAERDVTVTPSVMCMGWLRWWYSRTAHLVSSLTALAFATKMSQKHKSASHSAIRVKNLRKTIRTEEKLVVISLFEKGERIVDICYNVRLAHRSIRTICDNADRIKASAKCSDNIKCQHSETGNVCLCIKTTTVLLEWTVWKNMNVNLLDFYCIRNKYSKYIL
jgi:hypothetical protein